MLNSQRFRFKHCSQLLFIQLNFDAWDPPSCVPPRLSFLLFFARFSASYHRRSKRRGRLHYRTIQYPISILQIILFFWNPKPSTHVLLPGRAVLSLPGRRACGRWPWPCCALSNGPPLLGDQQGYRLFLVQSVAGRRTSMQSAAWTAGPYLRLVLFYNLSYFLFVSLQFLDVFLFQKHMCSRSR
jgi:hypothetical protein